MYVPEFDSAVPEPAIFGIIIGDRVAVSVSFCNQGVGVDSFADKESAYGIGALLRDLQVGRRVTAVIGVAAYLEHGPRRRGFDRLGLLLQHRHALPRDLRTA